MSLFFFSSRRRHTRSDRDWSSDVCSSDLLQLVDPDLRPHVGPVALHQRRVETVLQEIEQLRALELLRARELADRGNHFTRACHHSVLFTNPPPGAHRGCRRAAPVAARRPGARESPSPRRAPPRPRRAPRPLPPPPPGPPGRPPAPP